MSAFKFSIAAAFAFVGYAALTSGAEASTTSQLNKCRYNDKRQVVECCERILRDEDKPYWMVEGGHNCNSSAVCTPKRRGFQKASFSAAKPRCYIRIRFNDNDRGNPGGRTPTFSRPPRGNNNPNGGKN